METIQCLGEIGTKCVELTGGGEPMAYPHLTALIEAIAAAKMDLALVTNGTLVTPAKAAHLGRVPFVWVRVSIDAGTPEDYARIRNVPKEHWARAWEAVALLSAQKRKPYAHPESRVGVGYVLDRDNWRGVYEACRLAKGYGADNIRISSSFTPDGLSRFDGECFTSVPEQVARAKADFEDGTFQINDLSTERWHNVVVGKQEYPLCAWKEIGCVIGADANVYACCSYAYARAGLMGTIHDKTFAEMWFGEGAEWRAAHDPRRDCPIHCLYEKRNVEALRLMGDRQYATSVAAEPPPPHRNFV